ncbi:MAG: hypothetical protein N4A38_04685 [Candidatus Gracilibacteria bacterium]|nr:hypothetical protein [Candidatus Gracilibacteria bacterium]
MKKIIKNISLLFIGLYFILFSSFVLAEYTAKENMQWYNENEAKFDSKTLDNIADGLVDTQKITLGQKSEINSKQNQYDTSGEVTSHWSTYTAEVRKTIDSSNTDSSSPGMYTGGDSDSSSSGGSNGGSSSGSSVDLSSGKKSGDNENEGEKKGSSGIGKDSSTNGGGNDTGNSAGKGDTTPGGGAGKDGQQKGSEQTNGNTKDGQTSGNGGKEGEEQGKDGGTTPGKSNGDSGDGGAGGGDATPGDGTTQGDSQNGQNGASGNTGSSLSGSGTSGSAGANGGNSGGGNGNGDSSGGGNGIKTEEGNPNVPEINCFGLPGCEITEGTDSSSTNKVTGFLGNLVSKLISYAIAIGVIAIMIAGGMYMTSAGDDEKANKARKWITWILTGVVASMLAFAVINMIDNLVINLDGNSPPIENER